MSVRQVVRCDRCALEFANSGHYLKIGVLKWVGGELDGRHDTSTEKVFEMCGSCAHIFLDPMPMPAKNLTGVK